MEETHFSPTEETPGDFASLEKNLLRSDALRDYILNTSVFPREHQLLKELREVTEKHPWYFLADTVLEEVTFGWPRQKADLALREQLAVKLQYAINAVGLNSISLEEDPHALSGGFKRRLALAIQLVQTPDLLLLDEPLAGLDWKARADVVKLLKHLKKELTILVVSHDLKELSGLVDRSWRMEMGGSMKEESLPF